MCDIYNITTNKVRMCVCVLVCVRVCVCFPPYRQPSTVNMHLTSAPMDTVPPTPKPGQSRDLSTLWNTAVGAQTRVIFTSDYSAK